MSLLVYELIESLADVFESKQMQVCISESLSGGIVTGVSALIGSLLLGPRGLILGGIIGGVSASLCSRPYSSAAKILMEMSPQEKQKLYDNIVAAIMKVDPVDILALSSAILSKPNLQKIAIREASKFFLTNFDMELVQ